MSNVILNPKLEKAFISLKQVLETDTVPKKLLLTQ